MNKINPDAHDTLRRRSTQRNPEGEKGQALLRQVDRKRLHVHLPATLHKRQKLHAVEQDRNMTAVVEEALREYLEE